MKESNTKTMPITKENMLEGLITIGDIATSYMDVYDSHILAKRVRSIEISSRL